MRARLAVLASNMVCEIREVKLAAKPAEMIAISPKATVPVLLLANGHVIEESLDIMRWVLQSNDPEQWLSRQDDELIAANDGAFKYHLDRYKYPQRHASNAAEHRAAGLEHLRAIDARLASAPYLCGPGRGFTDAALMPFVRQFAQTDPAWFDDQSLPFLHAWLEKHATSSLFHAAMVRLSPWRPEDAPRLFPAMAEFA